MESQNSGELKRKLSRITNDDGLSFNGPTPTGVWNNYLDFSANKHGGTKISGPYFYGFSDKRVQYLLRRLPGYVSWEEVKKDDERNF